MKISGKTCYSHLLWLLCAGERYQQAVHRISFTSPQFDYEGMSGYIETDYVIEVKDLKMFADIWYAWHALSDKRRIELYGLAKGLGDCK